MKNIFNITLIASVMMMVACEPLGDTYDELDAQDAGLVKDFEYTLTSSDYGSFANSGDGDTLVAENEMFADFDQAKRLVPGILAAEFSQFGSGSTAKVFFEVNEGLEELSGLINASTLSIGGEELAAVGASAEAAGFLSPSYDVEDAIIAVLEAEIQDPEEGDIYAVGYGYASKDPIVDFTAAGLKVVHTEGFADDIEAYTAVSLVGSAAFEYNRFFNGNAAMGGFVDGAEQPNNDWLISPTIDLSDLTGAELRFHQVINFLDVAPETILKVKVASDYAGMDTTATWTELPVDAWPAGNSWSEEVWSTMDISAFDGETINIAFQYITTEILDAPTWEIGEVIVEATASVAVTEVEAPIWMTDMYQFTGGDWEMMEDIYFLTAPDYDGMGTGNGQPGRFNNFSSSTSPDTYLPTFLSSKYPYAAEGDELTVLYKYFNGSTVTRGDIYTYTGGSWVVSDVNLSFGFDGNSWVPDNTIKLALGFTDYQAIGEAFATSNSDGSESILRFGNFDIGLWSNDEIFDAITSRLEVLYPGTEEGQKYLVTYDTWEPGNSTRDLYVIFEGGMYSVFEQ
ncbi:MAG: choice-of-anchor J domain-containing protein [Cyclobacteriaceae bacterium]